MKCITNTSINGLCSKACLTIPSIPRICAAGLKPLVLSFTAASSTSKSILPLANTSLCSLNAPGVLPVEAIPALINSNFASGNFSSKNCINLSRQPGLSVMEPPINATLPTFSFLNFLKLFDKPVLT